MVSSPRSDPISLRLIQEMHAILLAEGRGADKNPGQFREVQNWIGPKGGIRLATFNPPPPEALPAALEDLVPRPMRASTSA